MQTQGPPIVGMERIASAISALQFHMGLPIVCSFAGILREGLLFLSDMENRQVLSSSH